MIFLLVSLIYGQIFDYYKMHVSQAPIGYKVPNIGKEKQ